MKELLFDKKLFPLIVMTFVICYNTTGFLELLGLFFWAKRESGGLEITTAQIGYITGGGFLALLPFQKTIYMVLVNKIGNILLCKYSFIIFPLATILIPLSSLIENEIIRYTYVVLVLISWFLLEFFVFTGVFIFSNNSVRQNELGKFNGMLVAVNFSGRMLSPISIGALFSYTIDSSLILPLNYVSPFLLLVAVQLLGLFYMQKINPIWEKKYEEVFTETTLSTYLNNKPN